MMILEDFNQLPEHVQIALQDAELTEVVDKIEIDYNYVKVQLKRNIYVYHNELAALLKSCGIYEIAPCLVLGPGSTYDAALVVYFHANP